MPGGAPLSALALALAAAVWAAEPRVWAAECTSAPTPLMHSHNDYERDHPLTGALDHGFDSVEADVLLDQGKLFVAHSRDKIDPTRTLEGMYLRPLLKLYVKHKGKMKPLILLIELKDDPIPTWQAVRKLLGRYKDILKGPVRVVITGHGRPEKEILEDPAKLAAVDGGLGELDSKLPVAEMPWISADWQHYADGYGPSGMTESMREKLKDHACRARAHGRRLRVWGAPDDETGWGELCKAGVGVLNSGHEGRLPDFMPECRKLLPQ